jgi:hypothetical protein
MVDSSSSRLAEAYLKTIVTVEVNGQPVMLQASGLFADQPVHVITAWNPGDDRPSAEENHRRDQELHLRLQGMGLELVRAIGSDPDSDHREEGWAVVGLSDDEARSVGTEFDQVAVFRLASGVQSVLWCDGTLERSRRMVDM